MKLSDKGLLWFDLIRYTEKRSIVYKCNEVTFTKRTNRKLFTYECSASSLYVDVQPVMNIHILVSPLVLFIFTMIMT